MKISCLIPAYNEAENISDVLKVVVKYEKFTEIIVIDDGSKDNTSEIVKKFQNNNSKLKLIINKKNLGKTGTIIKGIKESISELIVMIDSDLVNLTKENINQLITPIQENEYSLTILDRAGDRKAIWGWTTFARFFGGERAFLKKDFLEITLPEQGGYLLEILMNLHYINKKKKVKTIYCDNLYTVHDYNKRGFKAGFQHYSQMSSNILKSSGLINMLKQFWGVEEDLIHQVYVLYNKKYLKPLIFLFIPFISVATGIAYFISLNLRGFSILPKEKIGKLKNWGYAKISRVHSKVHTHITNLKKNGFHKR